MRQPAVLGEIVVGILLGNLTLLGIHALDPIRTDPILQMLASLGVILLLFEVGLQSTVKDMLEVGASSTLVAVLGVATPMALGWGVGAWLLPGQPTLVHAFLGAILTATSVGITARVLRDLGLSQTTEARIILGAAVLDDVLGLVILAALTGIVTAANQGGSLSLGEIVHVSAKALGFLVAAILLGQWLTPRLLGLASRIAYLGTLAGLSPIVGAFAAGLILETRQFRDFEESRNQSIESLLNPLSTFLVPVFFVMTGFRVALASFGSGRIVLLAMALTAAAWIGKQACSLGVLERGVNRLAVGLGMVPRGEVGLIFANVGATLLIAGRPVITPEIYSAAVIMVILTTLVTPPLLQRTLSAGALGPSGERLAHAGTKGPSQSGRQEV